MDKPGLNGVAVGLCGQPVVDWHGEVEKIKLGSCATCFAGGVDRRRNLMAVPAVGEGLVLELPAVVAHQNLGRGEIESN